MKKSHHDKVHRVNCLSNDLESIYHQAALKLGVSDSVMFILYMIHDKGDNCRLYDICNEIGISKQTINSAIRKLENEEILYLKKETGSTKRICLTEKGKNYINETAGRLYEAETNAFRSWTDEEIELYLKLMKKYNLSLQAEIEKMERRTT